jgi:hypothetical protein
MIRLVTLTKAAAMTENNLVPKYHCACPKCTCMTPVDRLHYICEDCKNEKHRELFPWFKRPPENHPATWTSGKDKK